MIFRRLGFISKSENCAHEQRNQYSEQNSGVDLTRRMTDNFFEKLVVNLLTREKVADQLVDFLRLKARLSTDVGRIVGNDRDKRRRNAKRRRSEPLPKADRERNGGHHRGMRARHPAALKNQKPIPTLFKEKVDDRFQHLRHEPAYQGGNNDWIGKKIRNLVQNASSSFTSTSDFAVL